MWLCHFAFSPEMNERPCCSTLSPSFGVVGVPNFDHSNKCRVESHCCSKLHFSDDIWCADSFHMLICPFISSLVRCLLKSVTYILIGLFVSLLLSSKLSLNILDNSQMCLLQIFSPCLWLVFSFSQQYPFKLEIFNFNEVQLINYFFQELWLDAALKKS